jgi:hypothetical protein
MTFDLAASPWKSYLRPAGETPSESPPFENRSGVAAL